MDNTAPSKPGRRRDHPEGLTATVSIALPLSEQRRLERIAGAKGISVSRLLRERIIPKHRR